MEIKTNSESRIESAESDSQQTNANPDTTADEIKQNPDTDVRSLDTNKINKEADGEGDVESDEAETNTFTIDGYKAEGDIATAFQMYNKDETTPQPAEFFGIDTPDELKTHGRF